MKQRSLIPLLVLLCIVPHQTAGSKYGYWQPESDVQKVPEANLRSTFYCRDTTAHKLRICQNRVHIMNKLFAADMLQYCKYNWWSQGPSFVTPPPQSSAIGKLVATKVPEVRLPGFDADFTNVAFAENTYLYAIRKLRVDAASDVWLCASEDCLKMQDVGFFRKRNVNDLMMYTASSYMIGSEVALPLVGKPSNATTHCSPVDKSMTLPEGASIDTGNVHLCFASEDDVYGPANNTFPPVMIPAYLAAVGVERERGPYGNLMTGTFLTDDGMCVRLTLPRHPWLLERGWNKQHGCTPNASAGYEPTYIFVSYFLPGWADWRTPNSSTIQKPTTNNTYEWLDDTINTQALWWRYARVLYCDDNAVSAAYSGAACDVEDLSTDKFAVNSSTLYINWVESLVIDNIPILVLDTYSSAKMEGPGRLKLGPNDSVDVNSGAGANRVNGTHVARWLFSADMMVRNSKDTVPWCKSSAAWWQFDSKELDSIVDTGAVVGFFNKTMKTLNKTNEYNCELLDSMGLFTLKQGTKDIDDFSTILSPGLNAWRPYEGETWFSHNLGFAGDERVPPQAVLLAMVEAIPIIQTKAEELANDLIATADMTATSIGAALNLYAFTMLAIFVLSTAGDFVKVFTEDILLHKKKWIWVLYVLPPVVFIATLLPAPTLALLQEVNARKNNPQGDVMVDFTQSIARGYGDYHLLIITAYKSQSLYQNVTIVCAWIAMMCASVGVIIATWLAWHNTNKIWRALLASEREEKADAEQGLQEGLKHVCT